jgi:EAL domain-containing protein (putative c-di-GMP-specific phosphodiesterase class I)
MAPGDGNDGVTLMKNADPALYRAKHEGKAAYHFFEPGLDDAARRRRQLEIDLRSAIREGEFELNFQPLYSLVEKSLTGFEALIGWNHPTRGRVNPAEFIALAEEKGLIVLIGEWVIREACHHASTWPDDISVAVNVAPKQFTASGLASTILQALSASRIAPQRLELEITESIFIADVDATLATLHSLRNHGVKIALDDFGTGYSSLSYLRSFPFDKVKIDRSLVDDLGTSSNGHAIIRAITTLADALGMETLAEGVEDVPQFEVLEREGCRHIQGFLFSRPVPAAAVADMLRDGAGYQRQLCA